MYHVYLGLPLDLGADTWGMLRGRWPLLFFRRFQCRLEGPRGVRGSFCERPWENIRSCTSSVFLQPLLPIPSVNSSLKCILTHHFLPPPQSPVLVPTPLRPSLLSPWTQTLLEWKDCGGERGLLNQETQTSYYSKLRKCKRKSHP